MAIGGQPIVRTIPAKNRPEIPATTNGNGAADADIIDTEQDGDVAEEQAPAKAKSSTPTAARKFDFLPDFNLKGDGMAWKEFAAAKNPQNENEKYLLAALWLHQHGGWNYQTRM